jgi:hypothetical protein
MTVVYERSTRIETDHDRGPNAAPDAMTAALSNEFAGVGILFLTIL